MLTLIVALAAAVATFVGVTSWMGSVAAYVPAIIILIATYILVGRRIGKRVQAIGSQIEKHVAAGRTDQAVKILEEMRSYGRWQFMLRRALDGEIGVLLYAQKQDFEKARPYLERTYGGNWRALAMLGAYHYRRKQYEEMAAVFERATKRNKKTGLLWSAWAWCEWRRGQRDRAIEILATGQKSCPSDENIKKNLLALQNLKKMKMNGYAADWWALHLEKPPVMTPGGGRVPRWMAGQRGVR